VAHFGDGPVPVVGHGLDKNSDTARAVTFVGQFFVVAVIATTGTTLNGPLDGVFFHVGRQSLVDNRPEPGVVVGIAAAKAGGNGQFPDDFGEDLAAPGVLCRLAMLDVGPFTVTSHT